MSFIGRSISQVFFQRASRALSEGTLPSLVENVFKTLVIIGMFPILILTIVGSDVFNYFRKSLGRSRCLRPDPESVGFCMVYLVPINHDIRSSRKAPFRLSLQFFQPGHPASFTCYRRPAWKRTSGIDPFLDIRNSGIRLPVPEDDVLFRSKSFNSPENSILQFYPLRPCRNCPCCPQNCRNKPDSSCYLFRRDYRHLLPVYFKNRCTTKKDNERIPSLMN